MRFIRINENTAYKCLECGAETAERATHTCTELSTLSEAEKASLKLLNYKVEVESIKRDLDIESGGYDHIPDDELADYLKTVNAGLLFSFGVFHTEPVTARGV